MSTVDERSPSSLVNTLDFAPHLNAKLGVQIRKRLIEQEDLRVAHERPAHRHPLALATGELTRLAAQQVTDLQELGDAFDSLPALGPAYAPHLETEADVPGDRHRRVERVGLEDHGDVPVRRR